MENRNDAGTQERQLSEDSKVPAANRDITENALHEVYDRTDLDSSCQSVTDVDTLSTHSSNVTTLVDATEVVARSDSKARPAQLVVAEEPNSRQADAIPAEAIDPADNRLQRNSLVKIFACYMLPWHALVTIPLLIGTIYLWAGHDSITTINGECRPNIPNCRRRVLSAHKHGSAVAAVLTVLLVLIIKCTSWFIHRPEASHWKQKYPHLQRSLQVTQLWNIMVLLVASFVGLVVCWTKYNDVVLYDHPCERANDLCKGRLEILRAFGAVSIVLLILALYILPRNIRRLTTESGYEGLKATWTVLIFLSFVILVLVCFILATVMLNRAGFPTRPYPYRKTITDVWVISFVLVCVVFGPAVPYICVGIIYGLFLLLRLVLWELPCMIIKKCLGMIKWCKQKRESKAETIPSSATVQKEEEKVKVVDIEKNPVVRCETKDSETAKKSSG